MKIVKCSKCGKYIYKKARCYQCGNVFGFESVVEPTIYKNVASDCTKVEMLIENKKYEEAIALSHIVIDWMPHFAGIFWLRLLARNKCSSVEELIEKGFDCEEDPDFCNALAFSTGAEHSAYVDIKIIVSSIKKSLESKIREHEFICKMKTNILEIKQSMKKEIDECSAKMFSLWTELENLEHKLYVIEMDCRLLAVEHLQTLKSAADESANIKTKIYKIEECTQEQLHEYKVKIDSVLQQSEQAKEAMENMRRQHPWVKSFSDLVSQRDNIVQLIEEEISNLRDYEATFQKTLFEIDRIEECHKKALQAVGKYAFADSIELLGYDSFEHVVKNAGLEIDVSSGAASQ